MTRQTDLLNMNVNADNKRYIFTIVSGGSYVLKFAPDGWKDEVEITRSPKYKGLFRKYSSNELKFPKDGRETLQDIYEAGGIGASATLIVQKWDNEAFEYTTRFTGVFDFSTYDIDELFVSIQVMDSAFAEIVRNRENIEVDLLTDKTVDGATLTPLDSNFTEFTFSPKTVSKIANYTGTGYLISEATETATTLYRTLQMDLGFSNITEAETQTKDAVDLFYRNAPGAVDLSLISTVVCQIKADTSGTYNLDFVIRNNSDGIEEVIQTFTGLTAGVWHDISFTADYSAWLSMIATEGLKLEMRIQTGSWPATNTGWTLNMISSQFTLNEKLFDLPIQTCTGFQYYEAFLRVLQKITGVISPLYSEFFGRTDSTGHSYAANGELGAVTKGQLIRGLDDNLDVNFPIKLEDLFQTGDSVFNIGMGIETISGSEKVVIEELSHFFDSEVIIDLSGRISESEIGKEVLPKWHYAQIKTGYKKFKNEIDGGVFEFNAKQTYATVIGSLSPLENTLDILAKFRADTNGINVLRDKYGDEESEDVSGDDDTFIVDCTRPGYFLAREETGFDVVSGVPEESNNLRYSPTRNIKRHGGIIRAGLEKANLNSYLAFQTTDRQLDMYTRLTTEAANVHEMQDIRINDLDEPLWWPEAYKIKCPFFTQDLDLLNANPYGIIKLADEKYGWVLEVKTNIDDTAELKLLRVNLNYVTPV